jgi:hypothetical protein
VEQDIVLRTLLDIAEHSDVFLAVEPFKAYNRAGYVRVALRAHSHTGRTAPLFDPVNGEIELAGYAPTAAEALAALRAKLESLPAC